MSLTPAGPEFRVNTHTADVRHLPAVAMDPAGRFVVAWTSWAGQGVDAQRYDASGAPQGEMFRINSAPADAQHRPAVAMEADGDFVIAWEAPEPGGDGLGVYARRYAASGVPRGDEFRVNSHTAGSQDAPAVSVDGAGNFVVAWQSNGQDGSGSGVYAQRYLASGVAAGGEFRVNTFTSGNQGLPSVAAHADGDFVVTWQSEGQDGSLSGIYAQRFGAGGVARGAELGVNTTTALGQRRPDVAASPDGGFVVSWESDGQDGSGSGVYARRYDPLGAPRGGEFHVNSQVASDQFQPSVSADSSGGFVVAWTSAGQDGSDNGVYAQRYNPDGSALGPELRVNIFRVDSQAAPAVAMNAGGDFVVAWESDTGLNGGNTGVYARRFAATPPPVDPAAPTPVGPEFRVNTGFGISTARPVDPAVAMEADGDFVVVWKSDDGDRYGIFGQRYDNEGFPRGPEFRVNTATAGSQTAPAMAVDADGDFVVAWNTYGTGGTPGVYARRYSGAGAPLGDEFKVDTITTIENSPLVAVAPGGSFVIAWSGSAGSASTSDIYLRRFTAQGAPIGTEFRVGATVIAPSAPSLAMDADGDFVVTWDAYGQDGSKSGVYARRFNAAGTALAPEFRVNTSTANRQEASSVAMDADGDFAVAWRGAGPDGVYGVFAQRYNAAGVPQGGEFRVSSSIGFDVSAAMDAAGNFVIAWRESDVFARRYDAQGVARGGEFRVNTFTPRTQTESAVAMNPAGDFVVAWRSGGVSFGQSNYNIYAQRYAAAVAPTPPGEPARVGTEFRVSGYPTHDQLESDVAADAAGNYIVTWTSDGQDGDLAGIYAQRYNAAGVPQGGEFRVNSLTQGRQRDAAVAMDDDGDFVVTWEYLGPDPESYEVYARRYSAAGQALGPEFRVNTYTAGREGRPDVAMDADGDFVIAWAALGGTPDPRRGIYGQRYNAAGAAQGAEFRVDAGGDRFSSLSVAIDADGDFVVAWQQTSSLYECYARRFNAAGVPQGPQFRLGPPDGNALTPSVAMDRDGDFVVVWRGASPQFPSLRMLAQRFDAAGAPRGQEIHVDSAFPGTVPSVAMDGDGDFLVAWHVRAAAGVEGGVYVRLFSNQGVAQGPEVRASTGTVTAFSAAAMGDNGNSVVTWASDGQDGAGWGVYARRFIAEVPPTVTDATFWHQSAPHRLTYRFSHDVSARLSSDDLVVRDLATGAVVPHSLISNAGNTATFAFPNFPNGVLPNGSYRATLQAAGTGLASDFTFDFFVLAGDINRDRAVNGTDFAILAGNFGKTGMTYAQGDLNGDGAVNGTDFAILAGNFGRTAPPPTPPPPAPVAAVASRKSSTTAPIRPARAQPVRRRARPLVRGEP